MNGGQVRATIKDATKIYLKPRILAGYLDLLNDYALPKKRMRRNRLG
jgi:hypothetical protein